MGWGLSVRRFVSSVVCVALTAQVALIWPTTIAAEPAPQAAEQAAERVEVLENRTRASRTWALGDGTFETESFFGPIHFWDEDFGRFEEIDTDLEYTGIGSRGVPAWRNKANSFRLELPHTLDQEWISLESTHGAIAFRPAPRPLRPEVAETRVATATPERRPSAVAYPSAFRGASLEYESLATGLKETIVLERFAGQNVFSFDLVLKDVVPQMQVDGSIDFVSRDSTHVAFRMPSPWMEDSSEDETAGLPAYSEDVHYEIAAEGERYRLDVVADVEWLRSPERVYPVRIDPTYVDATAYPTKDAHVRSKYPTTNYGSGASLQTGYYSTKGTLRTYIQPEDPFFSETDGITIIDADLKLFAYDLPTSSSDVVYCARVTENWSETGITYNNQPAATGSIAQDTVSDGGDWANFQVQTEVDGWIQGTYPNYGFKLWSTATTSEYALWRSTDYTGDGDHWPQLKIRWTYEPVVALIEPSRDGPAIGKPTAIWTYNDFSPYQSTPLDEKEQAAYEVQLAGTPGGTTLWTGSDTTSSTHCVIDYTGFQADKRYWTRVRARGETGEGHYAWSDWTEWEPFWYRDADDLNDQAGAEPYRASDAVGGGAYVDFESGALRISRSDFAGPSLGPPLAVGATYDSTRTTDEGLGAGWRLNASSLEFGEELLPTTDAGFEQDLGSSIWELSAGSHLSRTTSVKRSGNASLKFYQAPSTHANAYAATSDGGVGTLYQVSPGQRLEASAWVKTGDDFRVNREASGHEGLFGALLKLHFYDREGEWIGERVSSSYFDRNADWTEIELDVDVPNSAFWTKLNVEVMESYGTVYFDDISLDIGTAKLTDADGTLHTLRPAGSDAYERDPFAAKVRLETPNATEDIDTVRLSASEKKNHIPDPGIEGTFSSNWYESVASISSQSSYERSGSKSIKFYSSPSGSYTNAYVAAKEGGDVYIPASDGEGDLTFSAWVNTEGFSANSSKSEYGVLLKMHFYDSGYNLLSSKVSSNWKPSDINGWSQIRLTKDIPTNAAYVKANVEFRNARGTLYVDDIELSHAGIAKDKLSIDGNTDADAMNYDSVIVDASGGSYIEYELSEETSISAVDLYLWDKQQPATLYGGTTNGFMTYDYRVDVSADGSSFTTVANVTDGRSWMQHTFDVMSAKYIRIYALGAAGGNMLYISELEIPQVELNDGLVFLGDEGRVEALGDTSGNVIEYAYDASDQLDSISDGPGRSLDVSWSGSTLSALDWTGIDSDGVVTTDEDVVTYASNGETLTVTRDGVPVHYHYNDSNVIDRITDADGIAIEIAYSDGRVSSVTQDSEPSDIVKSYDWSGLASDCVTITTSGGDDSVVSRITWDDSVGHQIVKTETDPHGLDLEATMTYDGWAHVASTTDPRGNTDSITCDARGNVVEHDEKGERTTRALYNSRDLVTKSWDAKDNLSQYSYDDENHPLVNSFAVTDSEGDGEGATRDTYDEWGNQLTGNIPGSTTFNMIENGTFEENPATTGNGWDNPVNDYDTAWALASGTADDEYLGDRVIHVQKSGGDTSERLVSDIVDVEPEERYMITAWVCGEGELRVRLYDSNQVYDTTAECVTFAEPTAENRLRRIVGEFTMAADREYVAVEIYSEATGGAYFDNVRLEQANAAATDNFLENESLERMDGSVPDSWVKRGSGLTGAVQESVTDQRISGTRSVKINTDGGEETGYFQSDGIAVETGEKYSVSAWVKTEDIPKSSDGAYVSVLFYNSSDNYLSTQYVTPQSLTGTEDWQRYVSEITVPAGAVKAEVCFKMHDGGGTAWCDAIGFEPAVTIETYEYDSETHTFKTQEDTVAGRRLTSEYDERGRLLVSTIATDSASTPVRVKEEEFDTAGRLSEVTIAPDSGLGITASYEYSEAGRLTTITAPLSQVTTIGYDSAGRPKTVTTPLGYRSVTKYDGLGRIRAIMRPALGASADATLLANAYDAAGRVNQIEFCDDSGSAVATKTLTYDANSNVTAESISGEQSSSLSRTFDILNRLTDLDTEGPAGSTAYDVTLDEADLPTQVKWTALGKNATFDNAFAKTGQWLRSEWTYRNWHFTWDVTGGLMSVFSDISSHVRIYDETGKLVKLRLGSDDGEAPDGVVEISVGYDGWDRIDEVRGDDDVWLGGTARDWRDEYGYDDANRLTSWTHGVTPSGGSESVLSVTYDYDAAGNLTTRIQDGVSTTFGYDAENRLTTETVGSTVTTFTYDELGRLTSENSSSETTSFSWNALGQLDEIASPQMTATYAYGATGMREQKVVDDGSTVATTKSFWIGQQLAAETHSDGRTYQYLYGPSGMPLEVRVTDASGTDDYAFQVDHGGSVIGLSNDSGDVVVRYSYDPWGEPLETEHASGYEWLAEGQPLRYRGYYFDEESGQYYLPMRYYDSDASRFLSPDPAPPRVGDPRTQNPYAFCEGDPVNKRDALGAMSVDAFAAELGRRKTANGRMALCKKAFGDESRGARHYLWRTNWGRRIVGFMMPTAPDATDEALDKASIATEAVQIAATITEILAPAAAPACEPLKYGAEAVEVTADVIGSYRAMGMVMEGNQKSGGDLVLEALDTAAISFPFENAIQVYVVNEVMAALCPEAPLVGQDELCWK